MTHSRRKYHYALYAAPGPLPCPDSLLTGFIAPQGYHRAPDRMAPRIGNVSAFPYSIFKGRRDKKAMRPKLGRIARPDDSAGNLSLTYRLENGKLYGLFEKFP